MEKEKRKTTGANLKAMAITTGLIIRQQVHSEIIKAARYSTGVIFYGNKDKCDKMNIDIVNLLVRGFYYK